jgi:molybdenum cofactor biosynthesis enzyme
MVDVSRKIATSREAKARARIYLPADARGALEANINKKGSPLHTAVLGGIMGKLEIFENVYY